jgi:hypothetical protein
MIADGQNAVVAAYAAVELRAIGALADELRCELVARFARGATTSRELTICRTNDQLANLSSGGRMDSVFASPVEGDLL